MEESDRQDGMDERLARLEARVQELEQRLEEEGGLSADASDRTGSASSGRSRSKSARQTAASPGSQAAASTNRPAADRSGNRFTRPWESGSEEWLNRIGLGLLLLGLIFLFKYSIDQGWLVPQLRSAIGAAAGLILLVSGLRLKENSMLRQLLMGGGIAALYITGFATFQFYDFIPDLWLWVYMTGVTLLALLLSLREDEALLSAVGMIGGFGTPFMLYDGSGTVAMLISYIILLMAASSALYWVRGWRSMYWVPALGAWLVLIMGIASEFSLYADPGPYERAWLQSGALSALLFLWAIPMLRAVRMPAESVREGRSGPMRGGDPEPADIDARARVQDGMLTGFSAIGIPILAVSYTYALWDLSLTAKGIITLAFFGVIALVSYRLRHRHKLYLSTFHNFTAGVLLVFCAYLLLEMPWVYLALTAEALLLRYLSFRTRGRGLRAASHLVFFILLVWVVDGLSRPAPGIVPFLGPDALVRLAAILGAGALVPLWQRGVHSRRVYRLVSHVLLLVWLYHESGALAEGQAFASLAWGGYAAVLLIAGFAGNRSWLRIGGMATVFLLVAKMLLVDLSQLPAVWRILLFMGLGSAFLFIGYLWQTRWKQTGKPAGDGNTTAR